MPNNYWDTSEYEDSVAESQQNGIDEFVEEWIGETAHKQSEPSLNDVEKRLALASYYRELCNFDPFQDGSAEGNQVAQEIRAWARGRMEVLVGLRVENPSTQFSDSEVAVIKLLSTFNEDQIAALKTLADRLLQKPSIAAPPKQRVISAKPAPVVRKPPARPPVIKPQATPEVAPRPLVSQPHQGLPNQPATSGRRHVSEIPDGEPFKLNGQTYVWARNDLGTRYKKNVTPKQIPTQRVPMPTGDMLGAALEMHAHKTLQSGAEGLDKSGALAVAVSLADK